MKKLEIKSVNIMNGVQLSEYIAEVIKNQNDIIDWIVKYKIKFNTLKNKVEKRGK